ncbi:MAG: hypothetical protein K2W97_08370 [Chthoniobacterales bacterium]|nr:hypothetical protein [Chthoniobacterales bacterium]
MSQLSLSNFSENLPVSGAIAITQAAAGCGLGLLLADKMSKRARHRTSIMLLTAGIIVAVPIAASFIMRVRNRPHSRSRAQRQLESIRDGEGLSEAEAMI